MSRIRVPYLLAGLIGGGALLLAALCDWGLVSAVVAALTLANALLGALGLILTAMTGGAGILVVADARADIAATHAWHDIHADAAVIGTPAAAASSNCVDALYASAPQDESLRRVLLAHRFVVPLPPPRDSVRCAPARADVRAVAELDVARVYTNAPAAISRAAVVALADAVAKPAVAAINRAPRLIASNTGLRDQDSNASGHGMLGLLRVMGSASKTRLVANAGPWWDWRARGSLAFHRVPGSGLAADVIVLAIDRSDRDHNQALPDFAADATAPVQPGCRGPPTGGSQRLATAEPASGRSVVGKRHRPGAEPPTAPADITVSDNLGDRVPVGAAELHVVETYLNDMLGELLATGASGQDHRES